MNFCTIGIGKLTKKQLLYCHLFDLASGSQISEIGSQHYSKVLSSKTHELNLQAQPSFTRIKAIYLFVSEILAATNTVTQFFL